MNQTYNDFRADVLKLTKPKRFKPTKTLYSKHIIRSIRKKYEKSHIVPEDIYSQLIRRVNELLLDELFTRGSLRLPHHMGVIRIIVRKSSVYIEDGKLMRTTTVNWKETLKLWYENPKARDKKSLVRDVPQNVYRIRWNWVKTGFRNQQYYTFKPCRALKLKLKDIINTKGVPSYERSIYNY